MFILSLRHDSNLRTFCECMNKILEWSEMGTIIFMYDVIVRPKSLTFRVIFVTYENKA